MLAQHTGRDALSEWGEPRLAILGLSRAAARALAEKYGRSRIDQATASKRFRVWCPSSGVLENRLGRFARQGHTDRRLTFDKF